MQFKLKDRGLLKVGHYADLVLFDPNTILDTATFEAPMTPAKGIESVFVNGRCVWEGGDTTGRRPGHVLRR